MNTNGKEQRKQKARAHLAYIEEHCAEDIRRAIRGSVLLDETNVAKAPQEGCSAGSRIMLEPLTTTQALFKHTSEGSVVLLNFASYKHPGGGFLNGSMAQEEALCADSTLYSVLCSFEPFYAANRRCSDNGLYADRGIFSPGIRFLGTDGDVFADVVSVAAPNRSHNTAEVSAERNLEALESRCAFVYNAAAQYSEADVLILGAFGCGVFKQDPETVAGIFKRIVALVGAFGTVVFAVPKGRDGNYDAFKRVL